MTAIQGKRILIVEDEFFIGVTAREMLEELGAIVIGPVATVSEALRLAAADMDLALLDVNLHGHSSLIVAAKLAERNIPIVFATGYGNRDGRDSTGHYTLRKPYTQEKLATLLCSALEEVTARKASPS